MELDSVIAEWYLGLYPPEKMPALAVWALEHGFGGPALRDLAGRARATRSDEEERVERSLREMRRRPLDPYDAGKDLANLICQQIISGKPTPGEGRSAYLADLRSLRLSKAFDSIRRRGG